MVTTPPRARVAGKAQGCRTRMVTTAPTSIRAMVSRVLITAVPSRHAATATRATVAGCTPSSHWGRPPSDRKVATPRPARAMMVAAG